MDEASVFYDNQIEFAAPPSYENFTHRSENLHSVAQYLQKTFIVVDQCKKRSYLFNHNPALAFLSDSNESDGLLNEATLLAKIPAKYLPTFHLIIRIINDHIRTYRMEDENIFFFSFHIPFAMGGDSLQMCEFKVFPYLYSDITINRMPWIIYYQCDASNNVHPVRLTLHDPKEKIETFYLLNNKADGSFGFIMLKKSDLGIFQLASQGFSESEAAATLGMTISTLKRIKSAIMLHINSQSTAQTITILHRQGLL